MNKNQHTFEAKNIVTGYDKKIIIDGIDLSVPSNKVSVIIGSNGCGKSTLLKTMARLIKPLSGDIVIDGKKITTMPSKKLAQILGLLPQSPVVPEGITVWDLVSRGRFPYQNLFSSLNKEDFEAVEEALEIMGISELANRCIDELSGGQRQRVWIAMALAQQTDILVLDEPTTYLDLAHQLEVLEVLDELNKKYNTTIVMVIHELNNAARFAHHMIGVKKGKICCKGTAEEVMTKENLRELFNIDSEIVTDPRTKKPVCITYDMIR